MYYLDYLLLAVSILLVILIVLQSSKEDGAKAFTGEKSELFANQKQRGLEKVVSIATGVLVAVFFVLAILITIIERSLI